MQKILAAAVGTAMILTAVPAFAYDHLSSNSSNNEITVTNANTAVVTNLVNTGSSTGGNNANAGSASNVVSNEGQNNSRGYGRHHHGNNQQVTDNTANGGDGGAIVTGDAVATSLVSNDVNSNDVNVEASCGCAPSSSSHGRYGRHGGSRTNNEITVTNTNAGIVTNTVGTKAKTGYNTANGADASNVVSGNASNNTANGGMGGAILTGGADSLSSIVNVVNSSVIRVRRN